MTVSVHWLLPPQAVGALQVSEPLLVGMTEVIGVRVCALNGVTLVDGCDAAPMPTELWAATVKV